MKTLRPAPELDVETWLNTPHPLTLAGLRGKVVLIEAFQMLCPGCVDHGLPQATRVQATFPRADIAVIGLHTVFEHHEAQGSRAAIAAFIHEYRIAFPVGIDRQSELGGPPLTMTAYAMQGTPTLILIDRLGRMRAQHFGHLDDLRLGAEIATLIAESPVATAPAVTAPATGAVDPTGTDCTADGCRLPDTLTAPLATRTSTNA
ncbi:MAG: redoxin domain-containing protein [Sphingomonas sp.]|uniref:redoxin domain-containing protein n=1 Tax=Sphingomonas sp. TaxID=28214 RepID=UPI0025CEA8E6|nr:redoxin domain-containing protein [Sphingomonas sp.]MBY0284585.1 redoxin domain-containing protein [Sphingomonas sp.]